MCIAYIYLWLPGLLVVSQKLLKKLRPPLIISVCLSANLLVVNAFFMFFGIILDSIWILFDLIRVNNLTCINSQKWDIFKVKSQKSVEYQHI